MNFGKGLLAVGLGTGLTVAAIVYVAFLAPPYVAIGAEPTASQPAATAATAPSEDDALDAARKYVAAHGDRYLDHNKLTRGMKGYGLTVMSGTEIVKFKVEIVSVMTRWGPHQDVILAKLEGLELEKSSIIAGMSGSPCYIRGEDGKDRLIGAVAFGWGYSKDTLCGIQPITQMIATSGFLSGQADHGMHYKDAQELPGVIKTSGLESRAPKAFLDTVLNPRKIDFSRLGWSEDLLRGGKAKSKKSGLVELSTPLMVSGRSEKAREDLGRILAPMNLVPVQAGGVGAAEAKAARDTRLEPGSAVAIPLVAGDGDVTAIGTVTEIVGDRVLVFGHSMNAEGNVHYPMWTGYIHAVVSAVDESFKMGSALASAGEITTDEKTAVGGKLGSKVDMMPLTVTVHWGPTKQMQVYHYQIVRHRRLTPTAIRFCVMEAVQGWKDLPEQHTVRHQVTIDFGKLGVVKASNISSGDDLFPAVSDTARPVAALLNNPWGPSVQPVSVAVDVAVDEGDSTASIVNLKLDGTVYRPGETLNGTLTVRPFRQAEKTIPVQFTLPKDIADGSYTLSALDASEAISLMRRQTPHRFDPQSIEGLLAAIRQTIEPQGNRLYLSVPLPKGGLTLGQKELPDLPESRATIIGDAGLLNTHKYSEAISTSILTKYVLSGEASAEFTVQAKPKEILLRSNP